MLKLPKKIHYHEDDCCMIELLPNENLDNIRDDFNKIHNLENKNNNKIFDIHINNWQKNKISTKRIRLDTISKIISTHMQKFDIVTTWINPQIQKCKRIVAFWNNPKIVIFIKYRKKTIVENIWLNINIINKKDKKNLLDVFSAISKKYNLLIVDWNKYFVANINNSKSIEKYLNKFLEKSPKKNRKKQRRKWYKFW